MNFKLHRIEAYIETPEVTIRKVKIFGFMPMWTSLRFYVVYFTYFGVCFFDFLTTNSTLASRDARKQRNIALVYLVYFTPFYGLAGQKPSTQALFRRDTHRGKTLIPQTHSYTKIWVHYTI